MPTFQEDLTVNGDIFVLQNGTMGIGVSNPAVRLHVNGNRIRLENAGKVVDLRADGAAVDLQTTTNHLYLRSAGGGHNIVMNPAAGDGNVSVGTSSPQTKFHVNGNRIRLENGGKVVDLRADGAAVDLQTTTSHLYLRSIGHNIVINPDASDGNVGIGTNNPQAKLQVEGNIMVSGDIILQNADCAEEFDLASAEAVEPGTVMVLNEEGRLAQSAHAYDKRVAGVVSGAGEFKPALVLDRRPAQNGRAAIALMGKVYCKVDAQYAAIEVGDLLTTSPTPGCAMKATDAQSAFGAILGKALRPLRAGAGLIPVLVTLQ